MDVYLGAFDTNIIEMAAFTIILVEEVILVKLLC